MKWVIFLLINVFLTKEKSLVYGQQDNPTTLLKGIYWPIKPFIFKNDKGDVDGIIPMIFRRAQHLCMPENTNITNVIDFSHSFPDRKSFLEELENNHSAYSTISNLTSSGTSHLFWAPVLSPTDHDWEQEHGLRSFQLIKTNEIAVVVRRHYIDLPSKIIRGIINCQPIFIISLLMALIFSFFFWITETRHRGSQMPRSFIKGCFTSLWFSLVSMTTVGYGDVIPRSTFGRMIALCWLFMGVMVACVMTATMTNFVSGLGDFSVYGERVAVLENSFEAKAALMDYRAQVVTTKSYEEALELVRHGDVFAAMINADVAAWYQDEIQSLPKHAALHVIQRVPANLYIKCLTGVRVSKEVARLFQCMRLQLDEIYTLSVEHFQRYCHTETLHVGSILELCLTDSLVQVLLVTFTCLYFCGFVYDLKNYLTCLRLWRGGAKQDAMVELNGNEEMVTLNE